MGRTRCPPMLQQTDTDTLLVCSALTNVHTVLFFYCQWMKSTCWCLWCVRHQHFSLSLTDMLHECRYTGQQRSPARQEVRKSTNTFLSPLNLPPVATVTKHGSITNQMSWQYFLSKKEALQLNELAVHANLQLLSYISSLKAQDQPTVCRKYYSATRRTNNQEEALTSSMFFHPLLLPLSSGSAWAKPALLTHTSTPWCCALMAENMDRISSSLLKSHLKGTRTPL